MNILYLTNSKLFLFLINAKVHLRFHEKFEENLLLFFHTLFHRSFLLSNSLKFSEENVNRVTPTMEIYLLAQNQEYDY